MTYYDHLITGMIALIALYFKGRQLARDPRNPALWSICGTLGGLGLAVILGWRPLYLQIDEITGIPNLARYLMHALALVASASIQTLFLYLGDPARAGARARVRWLILAAVVGAMAAEFVSAGFDVEAPDDFATRFAGEPGLARYMLVYSAYLALTMTDILRMSARYQRRLPSSILRLGIRLLVAGSIVGLIYVGHKTLFIAAGLIDMALPWAEGPISQLLLLLGTALVAGGLAIPAVGTYVSRARAWPRRYRLYRDLQPLWRDISAVINDVALHPPRRRPSVSLIEVALRRRVIEIRDGLQELAPFLDPQVARDADDLAPTGLPVSDRHAIAMAASIAAMIDYVAATPSEQRQPLTSGGNSVTRDAGEDLDDDAVWLAKVSRAYSQSASASAAHNAPRQSSA